MPHAVATPTVRELTANACLCSSCLRSEAKTPGPVLIDSSHCTFCGKPDSQPGDLPDGEKPFVCARCVRTFAEMIAEPRAAL